MFFVVVHSMARVLGIIFLTAGILMCLISILGCLAGAGGMEVNAGAIILSYIAGKCMAIFGHILYTS